MRCDKFDTTFLQSKAHRITQHLCPRDAKSEGFCVFEPGQSNGSDLRPRYGRRILAWAKRHDITVVADEVYRRIWFTEPPVSALEFADARDHVVVIAPSRHAVTW